MSGQVAHRAGVLEAAPHGLEHNAGIDSADSNDRFGARRDRRPLCQGQWRRLTAFIR